MYVWKGVREGTVAKCDVTRVILQESELKND